MDEESLIAWSCSWVNQQSHPLNDLLQQSTQCQEGIISETKLILFRSFHSCIFLYLAVCMHAKSVQSCPTLCDAWTVAHTPDSSVHGILQARILEWAISPSRDLPDPGIEPTAPTLQVNSLPLEPPGKPLYLATRE